MWYWPPLAQRASTCASATSTIGVRPIGNGYHIIATIEQWNRAKFANYSAYRSNLTKYLQTDEIMECNLLKQFVRYYFFHLRLKANHWLRNEDVWQCVRSFLSTLEAQIRLQMYLFHDWTLLSLCQSFDLKTLGGNNTIVHRRKNYNYVFWN